MLYIEKVLNAYLEDYSDYLLEYFEETTKKQQREMRDLIQQKTKDFFS